MELHKIEKGDLKAEVKFEKAEVIVSAGLDASGVKSKVEVVVETEYFLKKLAEKIPGTVDDALIGLIISALKAV